MPFIKGRNARLTPFGFQDVLPKTQKLLLEGALTEEVVLNNVTRIMAVIRECNVVLRWFMLHTAMLLPGMALRYAHSTLQKTHNTVVTPCLALIFSTPKTE
jgi:hypothetical protein